MFASLRPQLPPSGERGRPARHALTHAGAAQPASLPHCTPPPHAHTKAFRPRPPPPRAAAMPILTSYAPALAAPYLETALAAGAADPVLHEQELAMLYLQVGGGGGVQGFRRGGPRAANASAPPL